MIIVIDNMISASEHPSTYSDLEDSYLCKDHHGYLLVTCIVDLDYPEKYNQIGIKTVHHQYIRNVIQILILITIGL